MAAGFPPGTPHLPAVSGICFAIVAYGVFEFGFNSRTRTYSLLRNPLLVSCGKYSYGMYALHLPLA